MKAAQLLVTVALIAAGIFIYDQVRGGREAPLPVDDVPVVRTPTPSSPAPTVRPTAPDPITLAGSGNEALIAEVERLQARVADLEDRIAQGGNGQGGVGRPISPPERWEPGSIKDGETPSFDADELQWFKAMKQEVERIEREEKYREMIGGQIDRLNLQLTGSQQDQVVKVTMDFRDRVRETLRVASIDRQPKDQREEALEKIRQEYEQAVYGVVSGDAADKILKQMGRYPGFVTGNRRRP